MRTAVLLALVAATPLAACNEYGRGPGYASDRPYSGGGNRAGYLNEGDYIYRDDRGNYYCKRPDGSTGAIVGGLAGGLLGNIVAPGGSKTLGTVLGALGGAVAGTVIDRSNIRCE